MESVFDRICFRGMWKKKMGREENKEKENITEKKNKRILYIFGFGMFSEVGFWWET